jgi:hypothetical protein
VAFWIALAALLVGLLGGLAYAVVRGIGLWRQLRRTKSGFGAETARIVDATAEIQVHLDRASASGAMLSEASARLAVSRSQLDVQLQALREARHTLRRTFWFIPGV